MLKIFFTNLLESLRLLVPINNLVKRCAYWLTPGLRAENKQFKKAGAIDGLPLPPLFLVFSVTAHYNFKQFYESGIVGANSILAILKKNNLDFITFHRILDFGCGCGRIIRHWHKLTGPKLYGTDYNSKLIAWCRQSLPFAEFQVNDLSQTLTYPNEMFDFIYAISVFTHLTEKSQNFWLKELKRVLKPRGYLLITVQGTTRLEVLTPTERQKFDSEKLVTRYERSQGSNVCGAYHSETYLRQHFTQEFSIIDFVPGGAKDTNQDFCLLRKL